MSTSPLPSRSMAPSAAQQALNLTSGSEAPSSARRPRQSGGWSPQDRWAVTQSRVCCMLPGHGPALATSRSVSSRVVWALAWMAAVRRRHHESPGTIPTASARRYRCFTLHGGVWDFRMYAFPFRMPELCSPVLVAGRPRLRISVAHASSMGTKMRSLQHQAG